MAVFKLVPVTGVTVTVSYGLALQYGCRFSAERHGHGHGAATQKNRGIADSESEMTMSLCSSGQTS